MTDFNIREVFKNSFGITLPPELLFTAEHLQEIRSKLGQAYYKQDLYGRVFFLPVTLDGYLLPFATIEISCKKNIISTTLADQPGKILEVINTQNYDINIKGVVAGKGNRFPEEDITQLAALAASDTTLELRNVISDIFLKGRSTVVITELKFPRLPTIVSENVRPYEITLTNDAEYTLELA